MGVFTPSSAPPPEPWATATDYDGGSNPVYEGVAKSIQPLFTFTVVAVSKAVDASINVVAHGLRVGNSIVVSGGSGDWAGMNGTHAVKAVTDANNFTIELDTSGYAGTFAGTITTTAPRTTAACWSISKKGYSATGQIRMAWANGRSSPSLVWDSRATYYYD